MKSLADWRPRWFRRAMVVVLFPVLVIEVMVANVGECILAIVHEVADEVRTAWRGQWIEYNRRGAPLVVPDGDRPEDDED